MVLNIFDPRTGAYVAVEVPDRGRQAPDASARPTPQSPKPQPKQQEQQR